MAFGRFTLTASATFAGAATASSPIDMRGAAMGQVLFPAAFVGGTATYRCAPTAGGSYQPVQSQAGVRSVLTAPAGKVAELPPHVIASHHLRLNRAVASAGAGVQTVHFTFKD